MPSPRRRSQAPFDREDETDRILLVRLTANTATATPADTLHRAGLRVDVRGPGGVLVSLGHGAESFWGRLLTGSRAVALGPVREVAASLGTGLPLRRATVASIASAGVAVAVFAVRRAKRMRSVSSSVSNGA